MWTHSMILYVYALRISVAPSPYPQNFGGNVAGFLINTTPRTHISREKQSSSDSTATQQSWSLWSRISPVPKIEN